ncbi:hypothetical protein DAERI_020079 [Deinococcus aerius]|uniref:Ferritin-like domain-containing protein n=2 Tax=Deinococcus TaxID=1298 RepID=A0A2I9CS78_9DEIO|nr:MULTISPECIES: ferritin-like domain-containing protein [Deinococcus]MBB5293638.1 hypothetical protein [Deinococcus metallilatus]QBY07381.1 hypothetical protein E5F05_05260 [Deinococcus metallilatus]RXJ14854.1 hypothetical protein ERJ73_03980 [Deinococcus metallilatus]TLK30975.1 ferritin-like domain-containing protein [Deinococcus metallilatus]GBF04482.1 hypothetical protein DAERI_020079 [Deinococcus aerius]
MNEQTGTTEPTTSNERTRRGFLRGLAGTLALTGFGQAFGQDRASTGTLDHAAVLDLAATAEALAVTLYHQALTTATFRMDGDTAEHLRAVLDAEAHHLEVLRSLGAAPLASRFYLPRELLPDAGAFADTALHLEAVFIGAYLAATHQFAQQGQPELAATAAQLGASEAQHLTLLSQLAGLGPGDLTLPAASFRRVADAGPALAPFLRGGPGALGPVALPQAEQLRLVLGQRAATPGRPFARTYTPSPRGRG